MPTAAQPVTGNSQKRPAVGALLKEWRARRRFSQLDFSLEAGISQRHLSFVESGRSVPSRDMVIHLAEHLDIPLRERNALLLSAGYAPVYRARSLDDPSLAPARAAIDVLLERHAPYPALAIDRHWNLVGSNRSAQLLLASIVAPERLAGQLNVLRLSLDPAGLAPAIVNFPEWRRHLIDRVRQQVVVSADPVLADLLAELERFPSGPGDPQDDVGNEVFVPLILATPAGRLSFLSTTTVFGTPVDVTLSEIAIESFFPADDATRDALSPAS